MCIIVMIYIAWHFPSSLAQITVKNFHIFILFESVKQLKDKHSPHLVLNNTEIWLCTLGLLGFNIKFLPCTRSEKSKSYKIELI